MKNFLKIFLILAFFLFPLLASAKKDAAGKNETPFEAILKYQKEKDKKQIFNDPELKKKYIEAVACLESGIRDHKLKVIEAAKNTLSELLKSKDKEIAAKAAYILGTYYYKSFVNDYTEALKLLSQAVVTAPEDSNFFVIPHKEADRLEKYLADIDQLATSGTFPGSMTAAQKYMNPYLRDYESARKIYDSMFTMFTAMSAEIFYAKGKLFMISDPKINDLKKAEENFEQVVKYHKDFRLYSDAVYLLAEVKRMQLENDQKRASMEKWQEVYNFFDLAEKSYTQDVKKKKRPKEPEFLALIQSARKKIQPKIKIKK